MEAYFSNLFNTTTSAPSAEYTITPATDNSSTSSTSTKSTSPSPATCADGSQPRQVSSTTTTTTTTTASPSGSVPFEGSSNSELTDFANDIFNATTYTIIFWIVTVYGMYKLVQAIFANRGANNETSGVSSYSRTVDIAILLILVIYLFQAYYYLTDEQKENIFGYSLEWTQQYFNNPWSLFELVWFTIIFFVLVYIFRVPMEPDVKPILVSFVEHKIWIIYAIFAVIYFFKYVLGIPIVTLIFNNSIVKYFENVPPFSSSSPSIFQSLEDDLDGSPNASTTTNTTTTTDGVLSTSPTQYTCEPEKQVFNVSNNLYTYEEAQKVCAAFDASLANYNQIEAAYNNGGEWCNYGWSDGQMAYFPTQKDTWEKLQNNPNTKHACGRPGINGGFIDNPYIRFGANCYGVKAPEPDGWAPSSYTEECVDNSESEEMQKLRNLAKLNSFNQKKWSRY